MTFHCDELDRALGSDDAALLAAARAHAERCASCRDEMRLADELTAAARTLHREWDSPQLWPAIAATLTAGRHTIASWQVLAAAAVLVLAVAASLVSIRERFFASPPPDARPAGRLLSDEALAEVERAEAQYIGAIEALARKAAPALDASPSPVLANLRERLLVIDAAIADCRAEIERNRFNAHLRRHLLSIYQEKRRTLEEILEQERHAS